MLSGSNAMEYHPSKGIVPKAILPNLVSKVCTSFGLSFFAWATRSIVISLNSSLIFFLVVTSSMFFAPVISPAALKK